MKRFLAIAIAGAALLLTSPVHAQYSINWYTIGGGGGASSGGSGSNSFSISGTVGQPATASMSGGGFAINGGFWSIISTVQTPGAPVLSVLKSGGQASVSWTAPATGFILQQSPNLLPGSWSTSSATLTTNSGIISATVPASSGHLYFRLYNP
jgi:opacity protein-like surface antigen